MSTPQGTGHGGTVIVCANTITEGGTIGGVHVTSGTARAGGSATKPPPTHEQMQELMDLFLSSIKGLYGERTSAIIMIGVPIEGCHDRFRAEVIGPCLSSRGLLEWGIHAIRRQLDAAIEPKG